MSKNIAYDVIYSKQFGSAQVSKRKRNQCWDGVLRVETGVVWLEDENGKKVRQARNADVESYTTLQVGDEIDNFVTFKLEITSIRDEGENRLPEATKIALKKCTGGKATAAIPTPGTNLPSGGVSSNGGANVVPVPKKRARGANLLLVPTTQTSAAKDLLEMAKANTAMKPVVPIAPPTPSASPSQSTAATTNSSGTNLLKRPRDDENANFARKKAAPSITLHAHLAAPPQPAPAGTLVLNQDEINQNEGIPTHPVFVDRDLTSKLRDHQKDGVLFLYRALNIFGGAICSDAMGLGKTLQILALVWALLSTPSPDHRKYKIVVACPAGLVTNWMNECKKWLENRLVVSVCRGTPAVTLEQLKAYLDNDNKKLLIVSYEMLRKHASLLVGRVDLLACDEGHRLKTSSSQTVQALSVLKCPRLLVSGTPIQNNLREFYHCVNFSVPNFLGSEQYFTRQFLTPIIKGRDSGPNTPAANAGQDRLNDLIIGTQPIILRRTNDVLAAFLPKKTESVVYTSMTELQITLYKAATAVILRGMELDAPILGVLQLLRYVVNDPMIVYKKMKLLEKNGTNGSSGASIDDVLDEDSDGAADDDDDAPVKRKRGRKKNGHVIQQLLLEMLLPLFPKDFDGCVSTSTSGKMSTLSNLLLQIQRESSASNSAATTTIRGSFGEEIVITTAPPSCERDKIVIVSNFTKALDSIAELVTIHGLSYVRLDGKVPPAKRDILVKQFNGVPIEGERAPSRVDVMLLSSKAGGVGLNLIGGNRLIMCDPDWNPANDLQAMARIWREGQKKDVFIYRLAATGTLEDKILERQEGKISLANVVVDGCGRDTLQASGKGRVLSLVQYRPPRSSDELTEQPLLAPGATAPQPIRPQTTSRGFKPLF